MFSLSSPSGAHTHEAVKFDHFYHNAPACFSLLSLDISIDKSTVEEQTVLDPTVETTPAFVNDHLTNKADPRIGELSPVLEAKTPWLIKLIEHSPFPRITRLANLQWIDNKNIFFLGWEAQGDLCDDVKLYQLHQSRDKTNTESIVYRIAEFSSGNLLHPAAFYLDPGEFHNGIPEGISCFYVFNEQLKWDLNNKITGTRPCMTTGSCSLDIKLDNQDYLYILGGEDDHFKGSNDLWCYNVSLHHGDHLNRWRLISVDTRPPKLSEHSMIQKDEYLILFGGRFAGTSMLANEIWGFNLVSEHWFQLPVIGELPRLKNCKLAIGNNSLFIYGGSDQTDRVNGTIYIYNFKSYHAYYLPNDLLNNPGKREAFKMTFDHDLHKLLIFGGELVEHREDLLHDCNEICYTHVYELNWSLLRDFVIPL